MTSRSIYTSFQHTLAKYPILVLTGPRQSGKTTMLRKMLTDYRYVSLENPDIRDFAESDPRGFLQEYDDKMIFDEVQLVPQLFSYLQGIVDENQVMGQFILSGSQNFNLMHNITQSLAGRVAIFRLFPFDMEEMHSADWLSDNLNDAMVRGFYPALHHRDVDPDRYYADYIDTYINRDVTQLINLHDNNAFRRFIKICATRAGQLVNYNNIAKDAGISHTTARNWLSLLETSYIIHFLQPYYKNYSKRVIKSPKLYFYDTGLLCHLLNIRNGDLDPTYSQYGNLFENMVVSEYVKQNSHNDLKREHWFWRDSHGNEIDLLYPTSEALHTYEIKSSATIRSNMFSALKKFESVSTDTIESKTVIYGGSSEQKRTDFLVQSWRNIRLKNNYKSN